MSLRPSLWSRGYAFVLPAPREFKGGNSVMGLEETLDARFLRLLPNFDFWFLLVPSLCPGTVLFLISIPEVQNTNV